MLYTSLEGYFNRASAHFLSIAVHVEKSQVQKFKILYSLLPYTYHSFICILSLNSNSNSIFIALNLHLKTDSRHTIQKKQKTMIINLRHSRGQHHREKLGKAEIRVDMLVQRERF